MKKHLWIFLFFLCSCINKQPLPSTVSPTDAILSSPFSLPPTWTPKKESPPLLTNTISLDSPKLIATQEKTQVIVSKMPCGTETATTQPNPTLISTPVSWETLPLLKEVILSKDDILSDDWIYLEDFTSSPLFVSDVTDEIPDSCLNDCVKTIYQSSLHKLTLFMFRAGNNVKARNTVNALFHDLEPPDDRYIYDLGDFGPFFCKDYTWLYIGSENFMTSEGPKIVFITARGPIVMLIVMTRNNLTDDLMSEAILAYNFAVTQSHKLEDLGYPHFECDG